MEGLVKGDVIVVPYLFSDLSQTKRRPALVLATLDGNDVILCQITSKSSRDRDAVTLEISDFEDGQLSQSSMIRPGRLFTADNGIILYRAGHITDSKLKETTDRITEILTR